MAATMALAAGGIGAANSLANAYAQSQAIKARAAYQATITKMNVELAEKNAEDVMRRGDIEARDYQKEVDGMIGNQRVAYASQGVDVGFGSAAEIQEETRMRGALDKLTIKNNAWREAWGFKVEASNASFEGKFAQLEARSASRQTMLTGGMQAISQGMKGLTSYAGAV